MSGLVVLLTPFPEFLLVGLGWFAWTEAISTPEESLKTWGVLKKTVPWYMVYVLINVLAKGDFGGMPNRSIRSTLVKAYAFMAAAFILVLCGVWGGKEYLAFIQEADATREAFQQEHKAQVKARVDRALNYIQYRKLQEEEALRQEVRQRALDAAAVATSLCEQNVGSMTRAQLEGLVRETLRAMRFNKGRGYVFALDLEGGTQLLPPFPDLEGSNSVRDAPESPAAEVNRGLLQTVQKGGQGYHK